MAKYFLFYFTILVYVPLYVGQTIQSYFNTCFGSGFQSGATRMVRSFLPNKAHAYRTRPRGLELVRRLEPYACIHGFFVQPDSSLHHVSLSVFEAYYEKVPNLIWNQSTSVTLRVFSLVDGVPDEVANISVKSEEQYPTRSFVHVYPDQFTHGPIYIGLDHNIPRGVNDMIYVHLNVIVTPVYRCQPTTPVASHPGLLTDLNLAASEDSSVNLFKCGRMPNKTEQQQPTDVCISVDLVCDGYNNCPLEFGHADESENHCTSNFIFQHNNVLWFLVATTCPIITIAIAIMLWASHRQCRYCCRKYLQKRSSYFNTESEFEITLSGTRTYSCGQTLSQNSLIRNSETRSARAATLPPNLAPPTYQEALKTSCKKTTQVGNIQTQSRQQYLLESLSLSRISERSMEGPPPASTTFESISQPRPPNYSECLPFVTQNGEFSTLL